ncbi:MAG: hypothetical protein IPL59_05465 [Candidatus Competibacteraceae bacterium]|nr:hypothetical protein [Candidatus Competibacteraceae bacterium]MBK8750966.1 hypothetical protein [Candidatus Competibacteraceae bacterium]
MAGLDGPCIFTARTPAQMLVLAYLVEDLEDERLQRFLVVTTAENTIKELKEGSTTVHEALLRGSMWLVDVDMTDARPRRAFGIQPAQLPPDALPESGTMLLPQLEPALRVKLKGDQIRAGSVPAAALGSVADIAQTALKPIFEWLARDQRADNSGRLPEWLRALYGLSLQRLGYGSLDLSFHAPRTPDETQAVLPLGDGELSSRQALRTHGWSLLKAGLDWAVSPTEDFKHAGEESLAILEALRRLAPASTGPVTTVEVSGTMLGYLRQPYRLTRASSKKIRTALTELKQQHAVQLRLFEGRIRNLDLDLLTLILRDDPGELGDIQLVLEDGSFYEAAREAHYHELGVKIAARSTDGKTWIIVDLEFIPGQLISLDET